MSSDWEKLLKPIMENNLEEYKSVLDKIERSLDTIYANLNDNTTLIHFLGILIFKYKIEINKSATCNKLKYFF